MGIPYRPSKRLLTAWSEERVRTSLKRFLAGKPQWPTQREFREAGCGKLRVAVNEHGGAERWAREFELPWPPPRQSQRHWTDQRIEAALRELVASRTTWPTRQECQDSGHDRLYAAAEKYRGHDYWAAHFGLPRKRRSKLSATGWEVSTEASA
jgi:hypothetical protein